MTAFSLSTRSHRVAPHQSGFLSRIIYLSLSLGLLCTSFEVAGNHGDNAGWNLPPYSQCDTNISAPDNNEVVIDADQYFIITTTSYHCIDLEHGTIRGTFGEHSSTTNNGLGHSVDPYTLEIQPRCNEQTSDCNEETEKVGGEQCPKEGNPIYPGTGNKFQKETDFRSGGAFPLVIERHYNSLLPTAAHFGLHWRSYYERSVESGVVGINTVMFVERPNGQAFQFTKTGSVWSSDQDVSLRLEELSTGWKLTSNTDTVEQYDNLGRLISITRRDGLSQTISYNPSTLFIERVSDDFDKSLVFAHGSTGRIETITSYAGNTAGEVFSYQYDNEGNLITVIYPDETPNNSTDNPQRVYRYEDANFPHALTSIDDENSDQFATWTYDTEGRATSSEHANGVERVDLVYNADGTVEVTDSLNNLRTYAFEQVQGAPKVSTIDGGLCSGCGSSVTNTTYDTNGYVASRTDFEHNKTLYEYDNDSLQTCRIEGLNDLDPTKSSPRVIKTDWNTNYRVPELISVYAPQSGDNLTHNTCSAAIADWTLIKTTDNNYYTNSFDGLLQNRMETDEQTNEQRSRSYTYDSTTKQIKTIDGSREDVSDITSFDYDPTTGNLTKVTNALNHQTLFSNHDANGRPQTITDPNGLITTLTYHPRGWLLTRTVDGNATTFEYDNVGQLDKLTLPTNAFIDYTYDAAHRLTDITDNLGNTIHYTLDPMGNRTKEETKNNSGNLKRKLEREYDQLSQLLLLIGGEGQLTRYDYDLNGNPSARTDPRNTGSNRTTAKTLDPLQTDNTSQSLYDALNRLVEVTQLQVANNNNDDVTTGYEYNALNQLVKVTDPEGLETLYTYNALGDLLQLNSPDTGITDYGYDEAGNRLNQTDARGITTSYTYNALNQLTTVSYPDTSLNVTYTYHQNNNSQNGFGRLTTMTDNSGQTQYHYDKRGNIIIKTVTIDNLVSTFEYDYNEADQLTEIIYPSGKVINYHYNASGQIDSVTLTEAGATTTLADNINYAPFGPMTSLDYGNGMPLTRQYDQDYRLSNNTQGTVINQTYDYDLANNIDEITDHLNASHHQSLEYDGLSRLIYSNGQSGYQNFNYDNVGNRTNLTDDEQSDNYNYVLGSHRLDQITGSNTAQYGYDANGNITSHPDSAFTYGDHNRISTTDTQSYTYNGKGERVKKDGIETLYYDYSPGGQLLAERDTNGDIIKEYVFLNGTLLVQLAENNDPVPPVDPNLDSDGDGIPDTWELQYGLDPQNPNDASFDTDNDGFTNLQEYQANTDPTNPAVNPDNNPAVWMIPIRSLLLN